MERTGAGGPADRASIAPLLADPARAVRIESARVLAPVVDTLTPDQRATWQFAAAEYVATQKYNSDRPEARSALGTFYADRGQFEQAHAAFASARALDPDFVPAYLNAADAYRAQGRDEDGQRLLEEGLAQAPRSAPLHHSLGLSLARQQKQAPALASLERAAKLAPEDRRYTYVYAVALNTYGRAPDAIRPPVRAVMQGFSIGRRAQWMIAQDWEALLALPIDEVRAQLGLERPTYYEQSAPLHDASRSRSRAAAAQVVSA